MKKLLITGATGNVGLSLIKHLNKLSHQLEVYAGVRDLVKDTLALKDYNVKTIKFDFEDATTFGPALANCDVLFLLRPPALADVNRYFKPLLQQAKLTSVKHIVFLSVQGVERSTIIPHHKIEALIATSGIPYTFLRPAYFMQNFTTTLKHDLVTRHRIYLPAGKAKFTLVDVGDIGAVAARVVTDTEQHINQKYELTCNEKLTFGEMAERLSKGLGVQISYQSPNLVQFFMSKRSEKMPTMLILVMIMLHYLPRFQTEPQITDLVRQITGVESKSFEAFIAENSMLMV